MNKADNYFDSDDELEQSLKRVRLNLVQIWRIVQWNYKICIQNNWIQYYYDLYFERCRRESKEFTPLENFEKDLERLVEKYCEHLLYWEKTREEKEIRNKIYFVYEDLIKDAEKLWNSNI